MIFSICCRPITITQFRRRHCQTGYEFDLRAFRRYTDVKLGSFPWCWSFGTRILLGTKRSGLVLNARRSTKHLTWYAKCGVRPYNVLSGTAQSG